MKEFSRRQAIDMTIGAFLGLVQALPDFARAAQNANAFRGSSRQGGPINWAAFLELVGKAAEKQYLPNWDQEAHVKAVALFAKDIGRTDPFLRTALTAPRVASRGMPGFRDLSKKASFQVTLISFEKGEFIPHHDHPGMTGVICCATGQLAVTNYEVVPRRSAVGPLLLEQVRDEILVPGSVSTLTAARANIHRVEARSSCQVIDIFTPPYNDERLKHTHWYDVRPAGRDPGSSLFYATARGG